MILAQTEAEDVEARGVRNDVQFHYKVKTEKVLENYYLKIRKNRKLAHDIFGIFTINSELCSVIQLSLVSNFII